MANNEINNYIKKRYDRWLDYASFHCACAGIADEAIDVLNEVLCDLLQKSEHKLTALLHKKSGQYTELDYFVLRMIKLNATSPTSPYRHKYRSVPVDANTDYSAIEIEDVEDDDEDVPGEIVRQTQQVRDMLDELQLDDNIRAIFEWRFHGEKYSEWPGLETDKQLFDIYYKVVELIKEKLSKKTLF